MPSLLHPDQFAHRHIGIPAKDLEQMLQAMGLGSLEQLIEETVPQNIRSERPLQLPAPLTEYEYLQTIKQIAAKNKVFRSYIGLGYASCITPSVILRNIFQNPGWYTQYTPYQAEISQGRLEALLNYQTMIADLTGLPIANASLLDEGTAAAEAMAMVYGLKAAQRKKEAAHSFIVSRNVLPQTLDVLLTRAEPLGINIIVADPNNIKFTADTFGLYLQYPADNGSVNDLSALVAEAKSKEIYTVVGADLLSLALLTPPGEWGADVVVGNSQRFGVPMGFGGPHAAFFATKDDYKRQIPGRIIGVSIDQYGKKALRMALQTREQHIRRDKATSNICTAQALLAIMASMYAVYHGPKGIKGIADKIHFQAQVLELGLQQLGYQQTNSHYFDTLCLDAENQALQSKIKELALAQGINFYYPNERYIHIALDETTGLQDLLDILGIFAQAKGKEQQLQAADLHNLAQNLGYKIPASLQRQSAYLTHEVFNQYHSESQMMRYIKRLENKDLSLTHSMISLGSCTMKLNAATELMPVSMEAFANLHPFVPADQAAGYHQIFQELEQYLAEITGFTACSLQSNSGAQGEYTGLMVIRAYHKDRGEGHRNIALIPSSAHGTNPASAVMAGMQVVVVNCDQNGNVDVEDLRKKADQHAANLACLMITYPSTHGVFETAVTEICDLIHERGGLVYMDGANMNAQVGLTSPGRIGADVCHLNLHKTFAIPHGGGGPGMGPICVNDKLKPFLPGHSLVAGVGGERAITAVSAAPWGSASILLISYAYIRMLGGEGCTNATKHAILNANYIKSRLQGAYEVLYTGEKGHCAHELILDLRPFKKQVSAEDVAKRLMDYGFHAPTLSFPVAGTIMIEPTESEDKRELDRFCDALLAIRQEIEELVEGKYDAQDNVLVNAPHTLEQVTNSQWSHAYSREKAAFPLPFVRERKFWASISRVNNTHGDKHLVCTCPPIESYAEADALEA
jgi:glycine dehydrogenase